ncbi:MAG TPA: FkbM family methyltransferase [Candidatus Dojkabacteria bacterium]|nr:FkbM family methyltransferase [Candidatus Dojkabacteria bacterium]
MDLNIEKIGKYSVSYFNKIEFRNLKKEIFKEETYHLDLDIDRTDEPNIIDVGAHIGLSILYFKSCYPNAHITAFEPNPNIFPLLEENIEYNNIKNVQLHNIAIGKDTRERDLYIESSGFAAFSTASFRKDAWNGKQKSRPIIVQTEPLSKYIKKKVDLLKVDTEGAEYEILKELDESGSFSAIENLLVEYHPSPRSKLQNLEKILKKNGYDVSYRQDGKDLVEAKEGLILIVAKKCI